MPLNTLPQALIIEPHSPAPPDHAGSRNHINIYTLYIACSEEKLRPLSRAGDSWQTKSIEIETLARLKMRPHIQHVEEQLYSSMATRRTERERETEPHS
jgi:hypothetical protein